ncbi:bifunctional hydroxymethylpyrimidine kinase/phosphomethylpyrimidine kinase [Granulicoccus sp. GXG6511]|uniref:bifunctional hydroxymethylpyrimidine kinase/phosphomethylpyrimidine kinase n=1 Tax=Granulicoccus sp. GXG6511 TaxID=3381351 RepID=UPI003D7CAE1C
MTHHSPRPVALTIAGSDPSGGAGIQADLKTFSALGAFGTTVITALTAQNTRGVTGVHAIPVDFVHQQLQTLTDDVRIDTVKIGMLASAELVHAVGEWLAKPPLNQVPIVLDPVMVATAGSTLLESDAVAALREILPLASLITPNLPEAGVLLNTPPATSLPEMREQADALRELGTAVLLKGGHLDGPEAVDLLADSEGVREVSAPRVPTRNTHGTGCTLSSAIAALRPQRAGWFEAVRDAKAWLTEALLHADGLAIGHGSGPVDHLHAWTAPSSPVD